MTFQRYAKLSTASCAVCFYCRVYCWFIRSPLFIQKPSRKSFILFYFMFYCSHFSLLFPCCALCFSRSRRRHRCVLIERRGKENRELSFVEHELLLLVRIGRSRCPQMSRKSHASVQARENTLGNDRPAN
jgi:hypothetical protein